LPVAPSAILSGQAVAAEGDEGEGQVVERLATRHGSPEHEARLAKTLRQGEIVTARVPEGPSGAGAVNGGR
jgi:hypothetical protein